MKKNVGARMRFIVFGAVILLCFAYIASGLVNLQIVKADEYVSSAGTQSIATIRIIGSRGMITDADSVILAQSEKVYNVTFWRDASQNSESEYRDFTQSIVETIDILEQYGSELSVTFAIKRDETTGDWAYDFGTGISESAWQTRANQWRSNHYLTNAKYDEASVTIERLKDRYRIYQESDIGVLEESELRNRILLNEDRMLKVMSVFSEMQMNLFNSVPIVIAKDVSFAAVSEIEGRSMRLVGMDIAVGDKRVYPRSTLASQVVGFVGPITSRETYNTDLMPQGYTLNDTVGKDGIESSMESWLTACISSRQGKRVTEKNNSGKLTRQLSYTEPTDGNNVKLTIIASYQQQAERAIAKNVENTRNVQEAKMVDDTWLETNREKLEKRDWEKWPLRLADSGCLLVLEVATGNVLAMAQYPTYDVNALVSGGDEAAAILMDERGVTRNYAIQDRAEPGSIFKMVTGLAALVNVEYTGITPQTEIDDTGPFMGFTTKEEDAPVCWASKAERLKNHQNLNIVEGLTRSCNFYFYTLGKALYGDSGSSRLYQFAAKMGLTSKTGIDLPGEARSIVGDQNTLYDPTVSLSEQLTNVPAIVAAAIKKHLLSIGDSYGLTYSDERLDKCIKRLMDMALVTPSDGWADAMRPILMAELNMTRTMVWLQAVVGEIWYCLNDIKWGGSMEVQMAIGQSITMLTPAAVSRYVAALANGGIVYNLNIIDSIISPEGEILSKRTPSVFGKLEGVEQYLPYIKEGMKGVVDDSGTARKYFKDWEYADNLWAKTGTSQITVGGIKLDLENNSWFVALAPFENSEIAVIAHIPNGFSGGESSLAIKEFLQWWMDERTKETGGMAIVPGNELMP